MSRGARSATPIFDASGKAIRRLRMSKFQIQSDFRWLGSGGRKIIESRFDEQRLLPGSNRQLDQSGESLLKKVSYIVGAQLIYRRKEDALEQYLDPISHGSFPPIKDNPFFWCIHLLLDGKSWITPDQKSKSAKQLLYAHRHNVPPEYLIGFIRQTGTKRAENRCQDSEFREPWFSDALYREEWIALFWTRYREQ